ncbi:hypothetical protein GCM10027039_01840 [Terrabacter koreensis]
MTKSVATAAQKYIRRAKNQLESDEASRLELWITEPRCSLAYAVSNLGGAIARLGHRIHDDAPGDYEHGQLDGQQLAGMASLSRPRVTREGVRSLLSRLDLPSDDAALERWGLPASAQIVRTQESTVGAAS